MADLLSPFRRRTNEVLQVSAELGGLIITGQPIPWNAEAVLVEACLRLPAGFRRKEDLALRVAGREPVLPVAYRRDEVPDRCRVYFRVPTPVANTSAEFTWCERLLSRVAMPVLSREDFLESLHFELPVVHARLGTESVACQTFVSGQCQGLLAGGMLKSPYSLAPLAELGLTAEFLGDNIGAPITVTVPLSGSQLLSKEALVSAAPRKLARRSATWNITWRAGGRVLATSNVRAIRPGECHRSMRLVGTRFIVDDGKEITARRQLPAPGEAVRVGPCFLVSSSEPGLAAKCEFEVRAVMSGPSEPIGYWRQTVLVTDGPTAIAPGTVPTADLANIQAFDLRLHGRSLGQLPLHPVPVATFTAEGGYVAPPDFPWTGAAEDELNERLSKLMGG
ncbi:MAG: hypothetical protein ACJ8C4_04655 [Gemmataceae bacterium]